MPADDGSERLDRDERAERTADLSERFGADIDEGGYTLEETLLALACTLATICHGSSNPHAAWMATIVESGEAMKRLDVEEHDLRA